MVKKSVKSVKTAEIIENKPKIKSSKQEKFKIQEALIDNFVSMQRVLTNLSIKFDSLADQIFKLLQLFEISAKSFVEKQREVGSLEDREFAKKLNALLEQNKTIARGLTLLEQKMREKYSAGGISSMSGTASFGSTSQNIPTTPKTFSSQPRPQPSYPPGYQQYKLPGENEENKEKIKPKPLPRI